MKNFISIKLKTVFKSFRFKLPRLVKKVYLFNIFFFFFVYLILGNIILKIYSNHEIEIIKTEISFANKLINKTKINSVIIKQLNRNLEFDVKSLVIFTKNKIITVFNNQPTPHLTKELSTLSKVYSNTQLVEKFSYGADNFYYYIRQSKRELFYILSKQKYNDLMTSIKISLMLIFSVCYIITVFTICYWNLSILKPFLKVTTLSKRSINGHLKQIKLNNFNDERNLIVNNFNSLNSKIKNDKDFLIKFYQLLEVKIIEINDQKKHIQDKNNLIESSLRFAHKLQVNLLQNYNIKGTNELFSWFVINKPLGIVSGDFYLQKDIIISNDEYSCFAVGDCVGHGTAGALMTILAHSVINEVLLSSNTISPALMLKLINSKITDALTGRCPSDYIESGLDISLILINKKSLQMSFAGAYRPCVIQSVSDITILKPNRISLGYRNEGLINDRIIERATFVNQYYNLESTDIVYMFSDGVVDQFSEKTNKKYTLKRLLNIIIKSQNLPFNLRRDYFLNSFLTWKGSNTQTDDVLFMAITFI